jgi:hypothetical protein
MSVSIVELPREAQLPAARSSVPFETTARQPLESVLGDDHMVVDTEDRDDALRNAGTWRCPGCHKAMALASVGVLIAMSVAASINAVLKKEFAREWVESLRVKSDEPLGKSRSRRCRRTKTATPPALA